MRMGRPGQVKWTSEQEEMIRELYLKIGPAELAKRMDVPQDCLMNRAGYLGIRKHPLKWTEEMIATLRERYPTDGPAILSEELGVSYWALLSKARRLGIPSTRNLPREIEWTEERISALKERYVEEGGDILAEEFGFRLDNVRRKASELGLHTIAGHARAGKIKAENATHCNIHYFDEWSPNMAYILGFLFADGCVSERGSVMINLSEKDQSVLNFIKEEMKSSCTIYQSKGRLDSRTGNVSQNQVSVHISSTIVVNRLIEMGMNPRKTYTNDPFPDVPNDMLPHFIRGYFDGDGSVSLYKDRRWDACSLSFVGSPKFITGIRDSLVKYAGMRHNKVRIHNGKTATWSSVAWTVRGCHHKFRSFIYPKGFTFCLQRKKDRLDKWLKDNPEGGK